MFEPYIIDLPVRPRRKFLIATTQGKIWYDPIITPWRVELEWLRDNVDFGKGRKFLDGGCHHGYYTMTLANGCETLAVDIHQPNLIVLYLNSLINNLPINYARVGIASTNGVAYYTGKPLGMLQNEGKATVPIAKLIDIMPAANIVKLDIEGTEYEVLETAIDEMKEVDTWIVELHPFDFEQGIDTAQLISDTLNRFSDAGFTMKWIDRSLGEDAKVEDIPHKVEWKEPSTVIATRR